MRGLPKVILNDGEHVFYGYASKTLIAVFSFLLIGTSLWLPPVRAVEYDDYMLGTVALQNHFSLEIGQEDVDRAVRDFPEFADGFLASWHDGQPAGLFHNRQTGKTYPFYFGTYSFVCIPVKELLKLTGIAQAKAYAVTNAILLCGALLNVMLSLRTCRRTKTVTLLLLMCSPILPYCFWPSAEVFICSAVVWSLVALHNRQFGRSAFCISLAGTLNATVMAFGFTIILTYLLERYNHRNAEGGGRSMNLVIRELKKIVLFGLCFLPAPLVLLRNKIVFGAIIPQIAAGQNESGQWFDRFIAYIFDLNLGFLPYMPLALAVFIIGTILAAIRRNTGAILFSAGFLLTVLAYARTVHINCGMAGIARYNAWSAPFLIVFIAVVLPWLIRSPTGTAGLSVICVSSSVITAVSVLLFVWVSYRDFTPYARLIMDCAPAIYNPVPQVFMTRQTHVDTALLNPEETLDGEFFAYGGSDGYIRKILLPADGTDAFLESIAKGDIAGPADSIEFLKAVTNRRKQALRRRYQYINLPASLKLIDLSANAYHPVDNIISRLEHNS